MFKLVQHLIVQDDGQLPPIPDCLYAYILAGNGVFLYANRDDLEVLIPTSRAIIVGLPSLESFVNLPRVPAILMHHILQASRENLPNEILFWFNFDHDQRRWNVDAPLQVCRPASVYPVDKRDPLGTKALIDLHSHALMEPFFSPTDDKDEQGFQDICCDRESERETRGSCARGRIRQLLGHSSIHDIRTTRRNSGCLLWQRRSNL